MSVHLVDFEIVIYVNHYPFAIVLLAPVEFLRIGRKSIDNIVFLFGREIFDDSFVFDARLLVNSGRLEHKECHKSYKA